MTRGLTIPLAHLANPADRAVDFHLSILLAACIALTMLALAVWAPPRLATVRAGSGLRVRSSRARSGITYAHVRRVLSPPPSSWTTPGLAALAVATAALVIYLTLYVPVQIPALEGATAHRYWPAALVAALVVAIFDGAVIARPIRRASCGSADMTPAMGTPSPPPELRFQFVPGPVIRISAIASCAGLALSLALGFPLWW